MLNMRLGKKIELVRKAKGLSLDDLSEKTGIAKTTLMDYENGKDGKLSNLIKIVEALGMNLNELQDQEKGIQIYQCDENQTNLQINLNININVKDDDEAISMLNKLSSKIK